MTSVSLMSWLWPCLTCARFHSCACISSPLQMLFKFQISFMCVCEKVQVKNCKSTMMFSGCTALKYSCSLLLDGQNSWHETTEDGFETNMTMQEKRRILFLVGPVLFHDKHMDYAA